MISVPMPHGMLPYSGAEPTLFHGMPIWRVDGSSIGTRVVVGRRGVGIREGHVDLLL